jgi:hypothetical protein
MDIRCGGKLICHGCHAFEAHCYSPVVSFALGVCILAKAIIGVKFVETIQMDGLSQSLWGGLGIGNGIKVINMPIMRG